MRVGNAIAYKMPKFHSFFEKGYDLAYIQVLLHLYCPMSIMSDRASSKIFNRIFYDIPSET